MGSIGQGRFNITLLEAAVLLYHVSKAARTKSIGFEDADRTLDQMMRALRANRAFTIKQDVLESALWSCNMLSKEREFWTPDGREFRQFARDLIEDKTLRFDDFYHIVEKKKKPRN